MTARALSVVCMSVVLSLVIGRTAEANGCVACAFAGLCGQGHEATSCLPSEADCLPGGGIIGYSAIDQSHPATWHLFARGRRPRASGRFVGKLKVYSDVADPGLPGFPARRHDQVYWGRAARFVGTLAGDRLTGAARYANGATCEFRLLVTHGIGRDVPNDFVCRAPSGDLMAEGGLRVGLIRVRGCRR